MTEFLEIEGGRLAYDVRGDGRLVVLSPGMGNSRSAFRELADLLVSGGYRVACVDLRGHGESTLGWASYSRADTANDLLALIRELGGGPAVVVGHSFSGGSATIAAARAPELVDAIVEIAPFTRAQKIDFRALGSNARYRKGMTLLMGTGVFRSVGMWKRYLDHAYPGTKPADFATRIATLDAELRRPGRMAVVAKMGMAPPTDAGAELGNIRCPALVLEGTLDPDWPDPAAEGRAVVDAMPEGLGRLELVEGAGHYAHAQFPGRVADAIRSFLEQPAHH
ncbi:alpha/beta fold hydrolase [Embleya hyalina]|uniref:Hydrolase n=1 Tax=Embleya hyalina TaxID=516124 RepID=A0A401YPL4_9ACTN|nr:alpha/beta hydrolase [Embleya hyalina]GCD96536.1 hydrolase [Embleya hyalina]